MLKTGYFKKNSEFKSLNKEVRHVWRKNMEIQKIKSNQGTIIIMWLGQSGYLLKNSAKEMLFIDPYLTNTISHGLPPYIHSRLIPPVLAPDAIQEVIGVLLTHDHQDHLDPNTIVILAENAGLKFLGSDEVSQLLINALDIPVTQVISMPPSSTQSIGTYQIEAVKAVHPGGAIGFIVKTEGLTLYFSGDTVLFKGMAEIGKKHDIDYAFLCCNGQAGNMDILAALHAVKLLKAKRVIPNHYGMYADNTAIPEQFAYLFSNRYPERQCVLLEPGKLKELNRV
jgi:L-ascorbate 6-phosphate lactonase